MASRLHGGGTVPPILCHPPWVHQCRAFRGAHGDPAALGHRESRVHRGIHVHPMGGGEGETVREKPTEAIVRNTMALSSGQRAAHPSQVGLG